MRRLVLGRHVDHRSLLLGRGAGACLPRHLRLPALPAAAAEVTRGATIAAVAKGVARGAITNVTRVRVLEDEFDLKKRA